MSIHVSYGILGTTTSTVYTLTPFSYHVHACVYMYVYTHNHNMHLSCGTLSTTACIVYTITPVSHHVQACVHTYVHTRNEQHARDMWYPRRYRIHSVHTHSLVLPCSCLCIHVCTYTQCAAYTYHVALSAPPHPLCAHSLPCPTTSTPVYTHLYIHTMRSIHMSSGTLSNTTSTLYTLTPLSHHICTCVHTCVYTHNQQHTCVVWHPQQSCGTLSNTTSTEYTHTPCSHHVHVCVYKYVYTHNEQHTYVMWHPRHHYIHSVHTQRNIHSVTGTTTSTAYTLCTHLAPLHPQCTHSTQHPQCHRHYNIQCVHTHSCVPPHPYVCVATL